MGKSIVDKIDNQFFKNIYLKMPKIFAGEFISSHICGAKIHYVIIAIYEYY